MKDKRLTWEEFATKYCSRQAQTHDGLAAVLRDQRKNFQSHGWMLLECQMMGSSMLGQRTILGFGGSHSYVVIPDHPISPRGLASDMSVVIGWLDQGDLPND